MAPNGVLDTDLGYTVTVTNKVASLAGCSPDRRATLQHRGTGEQHSDSRRPGAGQGAGHLRRGQLRRQQLSHRSPPGGCLAAPYGGLSLCAAEARDALVDVPSREVSSLALVDPLDSARSYLLRKLLPATAGGGPIPGTLGQREPPGPPLPPEQILTIAAWIDGGALP